MRQPSLNHRLLTVPASWAGDVSMLDIRGRKYTLHALGQGRYALPDNLRRGVYYFHIGKQVFSTTWVR